MKNSISESINSEHFHVYGYEIINSNLEQEHDNFKKKLEKYFEGNLIKFSGIDSIRIDSLSNYHKIIDEFNIDHHQFIKFISRKLPSEFNLLPLIKSLLHFCSDFVNNSISLTDELVWLRICRPGFDDSNDLHRDHWFPNYYDVLNLYVPICGSFSDSAMKIVPKSHSWSDDDVVPTFRGDSGEKYIKNGIAYSAPGILYSKHEIKPHRPDIRIGDFMIFDPKCIHGGGDNFSKETRISLEIRIQKK
jgi:hypothetical protein